MQFDWWTFALQVVNFLILVWLLQHFLYKPVQKIIAERRAQVDAKLKEAEEAKSAAEAEERRFREEKARLEAEREERLSELEDRLSKEKQEVLAEARKEAERIIREARTEAEKERADALKRLRGEIAEMAAEMALEILKERSLQEEETLAQFEKYVSALSDEEKRKLRFGVDDQNDAVTVVTSQPLTDNLRAKWRNGIADIVGFEAGVRFENDQSLVGGAKVRFPHAVIDLSIADAVARMKEHIVSE